MKLCYIKYESSACCGVAQHLTNTVFIDRALIVVPLDIGKHMADSFPAKSLLLIVKLGSFLVLRQYETI